MTGRSRLLFSEAWRSLGANLSTTVAATMTVLIGMFLLGLFIALGTVDRVVVEPREERARRQGQLQGLGDDAAAERLRAELAAEPVRQDRRDHVRLEGRRRSRQMSKRYPDMVKNLTSNPFPNSLEVTPNKGENVDKLFDSLTGRTSLRSSARSPTGRSSRTGSSRWRT